MKLKMIIAGGGTGGHIFPALAIADAIKILNIDTDILFVGAKGKMEMEKVPRAGYAIIGLDIVGYNRTTFLKNILLPFKLLKSFFNSYSIIQQFRPNIVLGVGGYSTFPVLRCAQLLGIATFIHESNSYPGKSNILLAKRTKLVFLGSEKAEKYFNGSRTFFSGNPVREGIKKSLLSKEKATAAFGLLPNKPVLLVFGGSLGARSINNAIAANLDVFVQHGIQLIWQTGKAFEGNYDSIAKNNEGVWINNFIENMEIAYAAADLVVCRSGAMTISELEVVGKPAVFVPYPFASEGHQEHNAAKMVEKGAAELVTDSETKEKLVPLVTSLIGNTNKLEEMKHNMGRLAKTDADETIAKEILRYINDMSI